MGRIFWQISMTLDGFMEGPGGELDRTAGVIDEDFEAYASEMLESIDSFIVGRRTYEMFVQYWPHASGPDATILNKLPKVVVSRTLESADWNNARLVKENVAEQITKLKNESERDIAVFGSAELAAFLSGRGLIDEYRLLVTPYVLGAGAPAFKGGFESGLMRLTRSDRWRSGTMALFYEPV